MTRGRYRSLQSYDSSVEKEMEEKMENEIIFMHMTQGDLAVMNRDYLMLCHCGVIAAEMCFHFSVQRAGGDETATGMLLVFCRHRYGPYTAPFDKMNHRKRPQKHLYPIQRNVAGCQVCKSGVNNECCFTQIQHMQRVLSLSTKDTQKRKLLEKLIDETG